jgi:hypothetical protein
MIKSIDECRRINSRRLHDHFNYLVFFYLSGGHEMPEIQLPGAEPAGTAHRNIDQAPNEGQNQAPAPKAKEGRIVHYTLNASDAHEINRRRTTSHEIAARIQSGYWSIGAQAHIGNEARAGQVYAAMIVRVWGENGCSNLQVFLDGNDTYWATSRNPPPPEGAVSNEGYWTWPERT